MIDQERDPQLSRRYAELGREEPPPELDAAVLSAARRAAEMRPAPLVAPTGRRRWYFPVAAAAVIVLAVAVTVQVEHEQPDPETAALPSPKQEQGFAKQVPEAKRADAPAVAPAVKLKPQTLPKETTTPNAPVPAPAEAARDALQENRAQGAPAARAEMRAGALASKPESPEAWLERVVRLREAGRDEEAERAFEDFKRRYPDYRIPEAMLEKLAKRPATRDK